MNSPVMLNIGCGDALLKEWINVDKCEPENVPEDIAFEKWDLDMSWHWASDSVDCILANDIIEHLKDKLKTMNEAYRILKHGGLFQICVPTTDGQGAFQDPTHVSFWNRNSFKYYEDGNPYRERFAKSYGIEARFQVVHEELINTQDGPKLTIRLKAIK